MLVTFYLTGPFSATTLSDNFTIVGNPGAETYTGITKSQLLTGHSLTFSESVTGGTVTATDETCNGTSRVWLIDTVPPSGTLALYAKFKNAEQVLQYSINMNTPVSVGNIDSLTCTYYDTITGLTNGDSIAFTTTTGCAVGGDNTNCPNTTPGTTYTYNFTGNGSLYLTVDGGICA